MIWMRAFRLSLRLLPVGLRRKHGGAMEALFARELGRARARGRLHSALAGVAAVGDVIRRGAYEQVRPERDAASERRAQRQPARGHVGESLTPRPTTRQLLRRHAKTFAAAFAVLTAAMLVQFATRELPELSAGGASTGSIAEALLLAVPFTAAMTIPMSVLIAVLWEFTRLGRDGTLAAAHQERDGLRQLMVPVLGAAAGVAVLAFVVTAEIVPRANARLVTVLAHRATAPSDRAMTIGELREASRIVRPGPERPALARAASYEVEIQKKLALPAACVILALAGMAIALSVPNGGSGLVIGASLAVLGAYYVVLTTGESLADRLLVSPLVGMWGANALLLVPALLAVRRRVRLT